MFLFGNNCTNQKEEINESLLIIVIAAPRWCKCGGRKSTVRGYTGAPGWSRSHRFLPTDTTVRTRWLTNHGLSSLSHPGLTSPGKRCFGPPTSWNDNVCFHSSPSRRLKHHISSLQLAAFSRTRRSTLRFCWSTCGTRCWTCWGSQAGLCFSRMKKRSDLKGQHGFCFTVFTCGGPCHLSSFRQCPLRTACAFTRGKNKCVLLSH